MTYYALRRLLLVFPVLISTSILVFLVVRVMPGDIATLMADDPAAGRRNIEALRVQLGLTKPFHEQYLDWLGGLLRGDLGQSLWNKEPVLGQILRRLPVTLEIALLATVVSLAIAIPVGVLSATRQNSWFDYVLRVLSIGGLAVPPFWLGVLVLTLGALWLHWVPPLHFRPLLSDPVINLQQALPAALVLGVGLSAVVARMTRSAMLEVLRQDYMRTAWAKGLPGQVVIARHGLKNALIPIVTVIGYQISFLLGGAVIIETVFSLPGLGRLLVDSIFARDYPLIQGTMLFIALLVVIVNLAVDLSYGFLDPTVRYG